MRSLIKTAILNHLSRRSFSEGGFDLFWLTLLIGAIYTLFLGHPPLFVPDDARYAEIGREMLASKDFITPHLNGVLYFEKPPLVYWLTAFSLKYFGINEWAVRLPQLLFALIGTNITYIAGRRLFDRRTGILAAFILAASPLYFVLAHLLTLDLAVSVLLSSSLFVFLIATQEEHSFKRRLLVYLAFIFAALAFLTKGLIGLVFPIMIIGLWTLLFNQWREIKKWYLPSGLILFFIIALPWHILVQLKNPSFFHFYFIYQQFTRYATDQLERTHAFFFFIPVLVFGFFPWSFYLIQSVFSGWKNVASKKTAGFLTLWIVFIFLFFSFSNSKLVTYILPIFPPMAILLGAYFSNKLQNPPLGRGFLLIARSLEIIGILIAISAFIAPLFIDNTAGPLIVYSFMSAIALVALLSTFGFSRYVQKQQLKKALALIIGGMMLLSLLGLNSLPALQCKSVKPLTLIINKIKTPDDELVAYDRYFQDMPFYVQQKVTIVDWQNELTFGYNQQEAVKQWMIDVPTFIERYQSDKRLLVISCIDDFQEFQKKYPDLKYNILAKTPTSILFSNKVK